LALIEQPAENVLGPIADLLLEDSSAHVQSACFDLLERLGAVVHLSHVRTDGWFEQFGKRITHFDKICEIMGGRFLAYSIILGIQIRSLTTDARFQANTGVEYTLGDDQLQALPLGEFRIRVVQAIIQSERASWEPKLPLTIEEAGDIIGGRNLLLAPLFDISLEQLVLASLDRGRPRALVGYLSEDGFNLVDLRDFDELIRGKVRRDLAGTAEEPFKLDLGVVKLAKQAFEEGDLDRVITTLDTWPGLLSILLRTPVVHDLTDEQRSLIGESLELLGIAFEKRDRDVWSEELFKLGLQFARDGQVAARLYQRLGVLLVKKERFGESIAILRRALALGAPEEEILASLGRAFLMRNKIIPATALLEQAAASNIVTPHIEADLIKARETLKNANIEWNVPAPDRS
jgi:hypothetical protein